MPIKNQWQTKQKSEHLPLQPFSIFKKPAQSTGTHSYANGPFVVEQELVFLFSDPSVKNKNFAAYLVNVFFYPKSPNDAGVRVRGSTE